jgi:hypothetical protein
LLLHLTAWGNGDSNIVAQFATGEAKSFAIEPEAQSFFVRAGITNVTQTNAVQFLVRTLKKVGLWSKIDVLYPFVGGTAMAHAQNLKSSSNTIAWSGSPTHNANGITGNGSSAYGDTGYTPTGRQDDAHIVIYSRTQTPNDQRFFMGAYSSGGDNQPPYFALYNEGANFSAYGVNAAGSPFNLIDVSTDYRGILGASRTDAGRVLAITRSETLETWQTSTGAPDLSYYVLAGHRLAGALGHTTANLAFASAGKGLTEAELLTYRGIINQFETILGRNVP